MTTLVASFTASIGRGEEPGTAEALVESWPIRVVQDNYGVH